MTAAIDVDGGSYNAAFLCSTGLANPGGAFWNGDLTLIAYAR